MTRQNCCFWIKDLREPFNLQKGWLLWAGIAFAGALGAIALTGVALSFFSGESPQRETDALICRLPLIGSSEIRVPTPVAVVKCYCICTCSFDSWRIPTIVCSWYSFGNVIRSNSQFADSLNNSCPLEFWCYPAPYIFAAPGLWYQRTAAGILVGKQMCCIINFFDNPASAHGFGGFLGSYTVSVIWLIVL